MPWNVYIDGRCIATVDLTDRQVSALHAHLKGIDPSARIELCNAHYEAGTLTNAH